MVITCELAGEFLGHDTDTGLFQYFRRHHEDLFPKLDEDLFPKLDEVYRTTLTRQAANLWSIKLWSINHMLRRRLLKRLWKRHPGVVRGVVPQISITDSFPMPVCRLPVCRLMRASQRCKV